MTTQSLPTHKQLKTKRTLKVIITHLQLTLLRLVATFTIHQRLPHITRFVLNHLVQYLSIAKLLTKLHTLKLKEHESSPLIAPLIAIELIHPLRPLFNLAINHQFKPLSHACPNSNDANTILTSFKALSLRRLITNDFIAICAIQFHSPHLETLKEPNLSFLIIFNSSFKNLNH